MSTTSHPRDQLSAYLDGALAAAERAAVEAHFGSCAECRSHLAELRGVVSLIAALPDLAPSRRLVPRLATAPAWVAPLRTLATLASGVSVFLFMATAILANVGWLAQGGATTGAASRANAPAAAPAASGAVRDAASPAPANADAKLQASAAPTSASAFAAQSATERGTASGGFFVGPAPWVWLVLAMLTGAIALALQRRLRSA